MKTLTLAFQLLLVTLLFSCNRELASLNETPAARTTQTPPDPISAGLQGTVVDSANNPIPGANVVVGSQSTLTDNNGFFKFSIASLDRNASTIVVTKPGFLKGVRSFAATNGTNNVRIKLVIKRLTAIFNTGTSVLLQYVPNPGGSSPPLIQLGIPTLNVVYKSNNQPYSGAVHFFIAYFNPNDPEIATTVPGDLVADDSAGNRVLLKSFGMASVDLETPSGEALQLAPNTTASLTISIPPNLVATAPDRIPLWYLDETTGVWQQEGFATKAGSMYVGQVSHFSFWNCDIPVPAIMLDMQFLNTNNTPCANAWVRVKSTAYGIRYSFTDSLGKVRGLVPANEVLQVTLASFNCPGFPLFLQMVGPFATATTLPPFQVNPSNPAIIRSITGTATNCAGAPVQTGLVKVIYGIEVNYYPITNGTFAFNQIACSNTQTLQITATDFATSQSSNAVTQSLNGNTITVPTIQACGNTASYFVNYNINGTAFSITSANPTNILVGVADSATNMVTIQGIAFAAQIQNQMTFAFRPAANPLQGVNPLLLFGANQFTNNTLPTPIPVVLTQNAALVGGIYEGTFTGNFTDSLGNANNVINCTFKVPRIQ